MSRVSLSRRIDRIKDHLLPPGSLEHRLERLSNTERESFKSWQRDCAAIISRHETEPGEAYRQIADGESNFPELPRTLRYKLWPFLRDVDNEPDPARAWQLMLDGDGE